MEDSARILFIAVVRRAVKDWRVAKRWLNKHPGASHEQRFLYQSKVDECERFFRSDWFAIGCGLDGEALLDALKRYKGE